MNKIEIADFCTKHNITLKQFFGFEEINEIEKQPDFIESENDEEFDVERSSN